MAHLSDFDKGRLCGLMEAGESVRDTARRMHLSKTTVQRWWSKYQKTGNVQRKRGSGRPRLSTARQDQRLVLLVKRNRFKPVSKLHVAWRNDSNVQCSERTARRRVLEAGYAAHRPLVRIPLSRHHRHVRLQWAQEHLQWNPDQWRTVLWTDESRFSLDFHDGRIRVRRLRNERFASCCITEHDRYGGGSVMIWAGMWWDGRTVAIRIEGTLTAQQYLDNIINPVVIPTVGEFGLTFQQDNARPHVARIIQQRLQESNTSMLPWPVRSPDLSPIEHAWDELGRRVSEEYELPATTLDELSKRLHDQWNAIPQQRLQRMIASMPTRLDECKRGLGGHTRY